MSQVGSLGDAEADEIDEARSLQMVRSRITRSGRKETTVNERKIKKGRVLIMSLRAALEIAMKQLTYFLFVAICSYLLSSAIIPLEASMFRRSSV